MGLFDSIKDAWDANKKFDEARGDEYGSFKDSIGGFIAPYGLYRSGKRIKDILEHPDEGIDATIKGGKASIEVIKEISKYID